MKKQSRLEKIYYYKLYSLKRFPKFLKNSLATAKSIVAAENVMYGRRRGLIYTILDMVWCNLRYGAMDSRDYLLFEFWKKSASERNKFFTKRRYFKLIKTFDKETLLNLGDKSFLYQKYSDFIKRDWMLADATTEGDKIKEFFAKHDRVLVKPLSSEQGRGIYVVDVSDEEEITKVIESYKVNSVLLEEVCSNCEELNRINSSSLNTLRIYTIVSKEGDIQIPSVSLRCGCGNMVVDNWGSGGVGYPVDIDSGIVCALGVDKKGNKHIYHPGTDVVMPGFAIPRFKEACEMAKDIIRKNMKVVYAGHDIAILPDRLELIEVNFPGGHDFLQTLDQIGKNHIMQNIKKEW
jgi:hypothetical protein